MPGKPRTRFIATAAKALFVLAVVLTAAFFLRSRSEPSYQGISLTGWSQRMVNLNAGGRTPSEELVKVVEAFGAMGTNCLPWLLDWAQTDDHSRKEAMLEWVQKHPALHIHVQTAQDKYKMALYGFQLLNSNAAPAVPQLTRLLNSTNAQTQLIAAVALASIGPAASNAVPAMERLATNSANPNQPLFNGVLARMKAPPPPGK